MVSNTDSQRRQWMRSGRRSQGCLCERVVVWHLRTLSKGHVDVVTGEWVAVGTVCVCVWGERESVCICASMEEAAMGMREMTWWQYVLLVVLEGYEIEAPVRRNWMPVTHGEVVMAMEAGVWEGWRCRGRRGSGAGAARCTVPGLLGAIGSSVMDGGGQQLRQSHWRTSCPFGFSPLQSPRWF